MSNTVCEFSFWFSTLGIMILVSENSHIFAQRRILNSKKYHQVESFPMGLFDLNPAWEKMFTESCLNRDLFINFCNFCMYIYISLSLSLSLSLSVYIYICIYIYIYLRNALNLGFIKTTNHRPTDPPIHQLSIIKIVKTEDQIQNIFFTL